MNVFLDANSFCLLSSRDWGRFAFCSHGTSLAWNLSLRCLAISRVVLIRREGTRHSAWAQVHFHNLHSTLELYSKRARCLREIPKGWARQCLFRADCQVHSDLFWSFCCHPFAFFLDIAWSDLEHLDCIHANEVVERTVSMGREYTALRCSSLQPLRLLACNLSLHSRYPRNRAEALWAHVTNNLKDFVESFCDLMLTMNTGHYGKLRSLLLPSDSCDSLALSADCLDWLTSELDVHWDSTLDNQSLFLPAPTGLGQWDPVVLFAASPAQLNDSRWSQLFRCHLSGLVNLFQFV